MNWLDKFGNPEEENNDNKYVKLSGKETDVEINLTIEPVGRNVKGTDGKDRLYWDVMTSDGRVLSCTNFLFVTLRKELERLRGQDVSKATVRIRKITGEKVSWVVVLVSHQ